MDQKIKTALLSSLVVLVLLTLTYIVILFWPKSDTVQEPVVVPTTKPQVISDLDSSGITVVTTPLPNDPSTTPLPPESLGGDVELPQEDVISGKERENLLNKRPLETAHFVVDYDFRKASFTVEYSNPNNPDNFGLFEEWLMLNYPNISKDEFSFKN